MQTNVLPLGAAASIPLIFVLGGIVTKVFQSRSRNQLKFIET
jgi:hypothetical protein